jgi:hypothetical protein
MGLATAQAFAFQRGAPGEADHAARPEGFERVESCRAWLTANDATGWDALITELG